MGSVTNDLLTRALFLAYIGWWHILVVILLASSALSFLVVCGHSPPWMHYHIHECETFLIQAQPASSSLSVFAKCCSVSDRDLDDKAIGLSHDFLCVSDHRKSTSFFEKPSGMNVDKGDHSHNLIAGTLYRSGWKPFLSWVEPYNFT